MEAKGKDGGEEGRGVCVKRNVVDSAVTGGGGGESGWL
jgi:hypothetical protein